MAQCEDPGLFDFHPASGLDAGDCGNAAFARKFYREVYPDRANYADMRGGALVKLQDR